MNRTLVKKILAVAGLFVGSVAIGAASGGLAGSWAAKAWLDGQTDKLALRVPATTSTTAGTNSEKPVATSTQIRLVPLAELQNAALSVPDAIMARKSPTATLYVRKHGSAADAFFRDAEVAGRVVAVTADGWFVCPSVVLEGVRSADVYVWYDHQAYKVDKAVADKATGATFIKTTAHDLPAPAFAALSAKRTGLSVWVEIEAGDFTQSSIVSYSPEDRNSWLSSDRVERRMLAEAALRANEKGAPLWDPSGSLVGLAEKLEGNRLWAVPAQAISASLQSLVSDGQIRHAALGVNALDLSIARQFASEQGLPTRGAWLKDDKKIAAITRGAAGDKAGLKTGDVILRVDRDILDQGLDLGDIVMQYKPGATVNFRVWRQGNELDLPVTFGAQTTGQVLP